MKVYLLINLLVRGLNSAIVKSIPEHSGVLKILIESIQEEIIDSKYICYNLDWGSSRDWQPNLECENRKSTGTSKKNCSTGRNYLAELNFEDNLLISAARELNGLLRVGGTKADKVKLKFMF